MNKTPVTTTRETSVTKTAAQRAQVSLLLQAFQMLLIFALATLPLRAQEKGLSAEKRGRLEQSITDFMYARSIPGISAAVVQNGAPVWSEGFGVADMENYVAAAPSTLYRLGSISKPITAVAAMQLWERGKLDLDAPVQKYCPAFPQKEYPITTRELLAHLGGIRHYDADLKRDVPEDSARHFSSMQESLQIFENDPLVAKPGTEFHYSTYGYTLVGCVLEGAASEKYTDYVHENVFLPAGMFDTQADNSFAVIQHRTRWYHKDESGVVHNAGVLDSSYKIPGGGLISSADNMAKFASAMLGDKLVKPATRELMWTVSKPSDGKPSHYGLGWFVDDKFGVRIVGHTGGQQGTDTTLLLVPARGAAVVVLANLDSSDTRPLAQEMLQIVLDLQK